MNPHFSYVVAMTRVADMHRDAASVERRQAESLRAQDAETRPADRRRRATRVLSRVMQAEPCDA